MTAGLGRLDPGPGSVHVWWLLELRFQLLFTPWDPHKVVVLFVPCAPFPSTISPLMCLEAAENSSFFITDLWGLAVLVQGSVGLLNCPVSSLLHDALDESPAEQRYISLCVLKLYHS